MSTLQKARICILVDRRGWAYDHSARQIRDHLTAEFDIVLYYDVEAPNVSSRDYDLLHVCYWGADRYRSFGFNPKRIIKEVSSHRWQDNHSLGISTPPGLASRYLSDCGTVICTSRRLADIIASVFPRTFHTPNGVDAALFTPAGRDSSRSVLVFGWAGNSQDEVKGFRDVVEPACAGRFSLLSATGRFGHNDMPQFYRSVDVFVVASRHEGEPLTLIEAMACGCFPLCVDVGIVPELIEHCRNGYIVSERTIPAFQRAFEWCENHRSEVRAASQANAEQIARERNWDICSRSFAHVYRDALAWAHDS